MRSIYRLIIAIFGLSFCWTQGLRGQLPENPIANLQTIHPRIFLSQSLVDSLLRTYKQDKLLKSTVRTVVLEANKLLHHPSPKFQFDRKGTLHPIGKEYLRRILYFSSAYHFTQQTAYKDQAILDMRKAARLKDWNPRHFLDVAELCMAMAIGYDWLYNEMDFINRKVIREAIISKGLRPGLMGLETALEDPYWQGKHPWPTYSGNWQIRCHAGLTIAALAIAEDDPDLVRNILQYTLPGLEKGAAHFAPEGSWFEGPKYGAESTHYLVATMAALESSIDNDLGLASLTGINMIAPTYVYNLDAAGKVFNFANSNSANIAHSPSLLWLANRFQQPDVSNFFRSYLQNATQETYTQDLGRFFPMSIWWYTPQAKEALEPFENSTLVQGEIELYRYRDEGHFFFMAKGGNNKLPHQQLDIGSFILEANGVRWAVDMGEEHDFLPGIGDRTLGGARWNYFRNTNKSHSTLTFNGQNQSIKAEARFTHHKPGENPRAILDMSEVYVNHARSVKRGFRIQDKQSLLITDEVEALGQATTIQWSMITDAKVKIKKRSAILSKEGQNFYLQVLTPEHANLKIVSNKTHLPGTKDNKAFEVIGLHCQGEQGQNVSISVLLSSDPSILQSKQQSGIELSLSDWVD